MIKELVLRDLFFFCFLQFYFPFTTFAFYYIS